MIEQRKKDEGRISGLERYLKFCLVGCSGLVIDMCVLFALSSDTMLGLDLSLSKIVAGEIAIVNNFCLNELWTFRQPNRKTHQGGLFLRFLAFNAICAAGVLLSLGLLHAQIMWLHANRYVANLNAIIIVSIWNFFLTLRSRSLAKTRDRSSS